MKRVKAWAVVDESGDIIRNGSDQSFYIYETKAKTKDRALLDLDERVVPVVIEIQEGK